MADTASERIRVEAPASRCLDVALDFESYPEWARDVREAKVLETDAEGRGSRVEFRAAALGKSIRYVLAYDFAGTRVHYELTVELAVPLPGLLKRRAAGLIMGSALKELKKQVEAVA